MRFIRTQSKCILYVSALVAALLAGCASKPDAPKPPEVTPPTVEKFKLSLEDGVTVDYQVEKKLSKVNNKSCFVFITGKLINLSGKTISKKTVLDIAVMGQGKQLYRDNTSPLADVLNGYNADFEMVVSPVFNDGCPKLDKINISLRKVSL